MVTLFIFFHYRENLKRKRIPIPMETVKSLMYLSDVHQTATKDGKVQWELDANTAELEAGSGKMILKKPVVKFFLDDGDHVDLTAKEGILFTKSNDIQVQGNVQMQNSRYKFTTQRLIYRHKSRILNSDKPIRIIGPVGKLSASNMVYRLDSNTIQFDGNVNGSIHEKAFK
ncbi:MAG: LPS export ABC transporter periplasmic protein LptC [Desulfobacteraceae bacterium]|nr:LPS export ABC transporter periplasmic protein LptC [Desulfobacteraceae bacterium]